VSVPPVTLVSENAAGSGCRVTLLARTRESDAIQQQRSVAELMLLFAPLNVSRPAAARIHPRSGRRRDTQSAAGLKSRLIQR